MLRNLVYVAGVILSNVANMKIIFKMICLWQINRSTHSQTEAEDKLSRGTKGTNGKGEGKERGGQQGCGVALLIKVHYVLAWKWPCVALCNIIYSLNLKRAQRSLFRESGGIYKVGGMRNRKNLRSYHWQARLWASNICPFIYTFSLRKGFEGIRLITKMSISH